MIDWQLRADRAETLAGRLPAAAQALRFFCAVTRAQAAIHKHIAPRILAGQAPEEAAGLLVAHAAPFVEQVAAAAPAALAAAGRALSPRAWAALLDAGLRGEDAGPDPPRTDLQGFWARALLHPCWAAAAARRDSVQHEEGRCGVCAAPPLCGVLREDRDAGAAVKWLCCGRCGSRWRARRVSCPGCGEEDPERLPRYSAEELPWVRVEACESCQRYLKVIDLSKEQGAEPMADELGALALDLFAAERGYRKLSPNLIGV